MYKILEYLEILEKRIMRYVVAIIIFIMGLYFINFNKIYKFISNYFKDMFPDSLIISILLILSFLFIIFIAECINTINTKIKNYIKNKKETKLIKKWWNDLE